MYQSYVMFSAALNPLTTQHNTTHSRDFYHKYPRIMDSENFPAPDHTSESFQDQKEKKR
ncbi:hypothetical protein BofuT4_uP090300.1 [Botrytis cinerea T4]|uniref:Uncharacterized protein n=1 Tax=Botryotinia fuckeliana (strain T4) TaxID=999810 RepID=G2YEV0_BOTF4|nr:hypothetical protein BofuT4_uP090300.1 [Botrytis cinerea T4]